MVSKFNQFNYDNLSFLAKSQSDSLNPLMRIFSCKQGERIDTPSVAQSVPHGIYCCFPSEEAVEKAFGYSNYLDESLDGYPLAVKEFQESVYDRFDIIEEDNGLGEPQYEEGFYDRMLQVGEGGDPDYYYYWVRLPFLTNPCINLDEPENPLQEFLGPILEHISQVILVWNGIVLFSGPVVTAPEGNCSRLDSKFRTSSSSTKRILKDCENLPILTFPEILLNRAVYSIDLVPGSYQHLFDPLKINPPKVSALSQKHPQTQGFTKKANFGGFVITDVSLVTAFLKSIKHQFLTEDGQNNSHIYEELSFYPVILTSAQDNSSGTPESFRCLFSEFSDVANDTNPVDFYLTELDKLYKSYDDKVHQILFVTEVGVVEGCTVVPRISNNMATKSNYCGIFRMSVDTRNNLVSPAEDIEILADNLRESPWELAKRFHVGVLTEYLAGINMATIPTTGNVAILLNCNTYSGIDNGNTYY